MPRRRTFPQSLVTSCFLRSNRLSGFGHNNTKHGGEGKQPVTQVDEVRAKLWIAALLRPLNSLSDDRLNKAMVTTLTVKDIFSCLHSQRL